MTADVLPFPSRSDRPVLETPSAFPLHGSNAAAIDVLAERFRLAEARTAGVTLPMPIGERERAVRWAADMILQIEAFDASR